MSDQTIPEPSQKDPKKESNQGITFEGNAIVEGDVFTGDKVSGDKVAGDKIVNTTILQSGDQPEPNPDFQADPYLGSVPYSSRDGKRFYGREALVNDILHQLDNSSFISLIGASKAGKTSLLNAGIIPNLPNNWEVSYIPTLALNPLLTLENAIGSPVELTLGEADTLYQMGTSAIADDIEASLLIIDEFEAVFDASFDPTIRSALLDNIQTVATNNQAFKIIICTSSDKTVHRHLLVQEA